MSCIQIKNNILLQNKTKNIMRLQKALKLKKVIAGEIATLKHQIQQKNSYVVGSANAEKFDMNALYVQLLEKTQTLINLKFAINEANKGIQSLIYALSEYKSLIQFWQGVSVTEGTLNQGYGQNLMAVEYVVTFDELEKNKIIAEFQAKVISLQDDIDTYNYTVEIPWEDETPLDESIVEAKGIALTSVASAE